MTPTEFDILMYRLIGQGMKPTDAFWKINLDYEEKWGKPRYSDYNSYRVARHRRLRKKS